MNKQQKIIVSIVGITIVLLALLGLTYAYYLTRIEGNTNTNSISVTTANLKLVYGDGNGIISAKNIVPGTKLDTKTFMVTNNGNTTIENYAVSLDYAEIIEDGKLIIPSVFERPEDFEITLTCIDNEGKDCNSVKTNFNNEVIILTTSSIEPNEIHNYSLSINYANPNVDQSNDMGKNLNLKIQIFNVNETADINGVITGVDEKYIVKIESDPKLSTIIKDGNNYYYKFRGVEIGTHTLTIIDSDGEEVGSQQLVIKSGKNKNIGTTMVEDEIVPEITITEKDRVTNISSTVSNNTLSNNVNDIDSFNPYDGDKNTLAYNILNNTKLNKNGTVYRENPVSKVAQEFIGTNSEEFTYYTMYTDDLPNGHEWGMADLYIGDTIEDALTTYNGISFYEEAVGKYVYSFLDGWVMYLDSYDSTTHLLTFKINSEQTLTKTIDDYGTSYYYRGNVRDNYLEYNNMCWRIVRIEGDGSIKLILTSQKQCSVTTGADSSIIARGNYGYSTKYFTNSKGEVSEDKLHAADYINPQEDRDSSMKIILENWFEEKNFDLTELKRDKWCIYKNYFYDDLLKSVSVTFEDAKYKRLMFYSDSYIRLAGSMSNRYATLKCKESEHLVDNAYMGALTADEVVYAGGLVNEGYNTDFYLMANSGYSGWYTLSLSSISFSEDYMFIVNSRGIEFGDGGNNGYTNSGSLGVRPAITLKSGTLLSGGEGTKNNPYIIN